MFSSAFDKAKSDKNKRERGLDFVEARAIWLDPAMRQVEARTTDGEIRYATIGFIGNNLWVAIWTNEVSPLTEIDPAREPLIRIISVHRADRKFERIYYDKGE